MRQARSQGSDHGHALGLRGLALETVGTPEKETEEHDGGTQEGDRDGADHRGLAHEIAAQDVHPPLQLQLGDADHQRPQLADRHLLELSLEPQLATPVELVRLVDRHALRRRQLRAVLVDHRAVAIADLHRVHELAAHEHRAEVLLRLLRHADHHEQVLLTQLLGFGRQLLGHRLRRLPRLDQDLLQLALGKRLQDQPAEERDVEEHEEPEEDRDRHPHAPGRQDRVAEGRVSEGRVSEGHVDSIAPPRPGRCSPGPWSGPDMSEMRSN